jgi:hypothetical protein
MRIKWYIERPPEGDPDAPLGTVPNEKPFDTDGIPPVVGGEVSIGDYRKPRGGGMRERFRVAAVTHTLSRCRSNIKMVRNQYTGSAEGNLRAFAQAVDGTVDMGSADGAAHIDYTRHECEVILRPFIDLPRVGEGVTVIEDGGLRTEDRRRENCIHYSTNPDYPGWCYRTDSTRKCLEKKVAQCKHYKER